jgi:hypothetical protein
MESYISLSCGDVVARGDSVIVNNPSGVHDLVLAVEEVMRADPMAGYDHVDARICLRFCDSHGVVIAAMSLSPTGQAEMHGRVYKMDTGFLSQLVSHLPEGYLER